MSERHIIGPREDGYIVFEEGLYMGLMDNEGNVAISPDKHFRSIGDFIDGVAIAFGHLEKPEGGRWGLIDERGNEITDVERWQIDFQRIIRFTIWLSPRIYHRQQYHS